MTVNKQPVEFDAVANRLIGVQMLRAIAVIGVLLYHASFYVLQRANGKFNSSWLTQIDVRFSWGVQLFFAISGFVMWSVASRTSVTRFMLDRVLRIFPPYILIVVLAAVTKILVFGSSAFEPSYLLSMTLLPLGPRSYPLGVEWSLVYEVAFYVVIALSISFPMRFRPLVLLIWTSVILAAALVRPAWATVLLPTPVQILVSAFCIPFIAGCIAAMIFAKAKRTYIPICWLVTLFFIIVGGLAARTETHLAFLGIGFSSLVLAIAWTDLSRAGKFINELVRVGDWSYGIYLAHVPVITIFLAITPIRTAESDFFSCDFDCFFNRRTIWTV